ncbi:MAG: DedA family protein [Lentimicrobiaceae bacterium]|nr:DedA family protein [Lentimicrobiaceae bacterium]MCO5264416.1 DedA family protein [Lentimicrobium sp.]HPG32410.1 DedA family protein [Lentimicrobium sp.]
MHSVIDWYMMNISYLTVFLLMAIEGSFIPFPSEVVIPPAAWKAAQGDLNVYMVVVAGTAGALAGSLINYFLSYYLGRKIVYAFADTRVARMLLITPEKVEKAEHYFVKHGRSSTFIGRLVPGVRQLISIPAGLSKMPLKDFIVYTLLGAGIWNIILAALGYFLYSQKELLDLYYKELSYIMLVLGILFVAYLIFSGMRKKASKAS